MNRSPSEKKQRVLLGGNINKPESPSVSNFFQTMMFGDGIFGRSETTQEASIATGIPRKAISGEFSHLKVDSQTKRPSVIGATGTCFNLYKSDLPTKNPFGVFHDFCSSDEFTKCCMASGLQNPTYVDASGYAPFSNVLAGVLPISPPEKPEVSVEAKFMEALKMCSDGDGLAIVFHGTRRENIPNILVNGLDKSRRSGQAYGPGEYFSKRPDTSISYSQNSLEMLVFLVVIPHYMEPTEEIIDGKPVKAARLKHPPFEYVVVDNNANQMPLGVVKFTGTDAEAVQRSTQLRHLLQTFNLKVIDASKKLEEMKIKAQIIQYIIQGKYDNAEGRWRKHRVHLSAIAQKEISFYANNKLQDAGLVECLFENIPKPPSAEEWDAICVTVEELASEARSAQDELDAAFLRERDRILNVHRPDPFGARFP